MSDHERFDSIIKRFSPRIQYATDFDPAIQYAITFAEPLLPVVRRIEAENGMQGMCERYPAWATFWYAGVISAIMRTLPDADPWTQRYPLTTPPLAAQAQRDAAPRFGTVLDAIDLCAPISDDYESDLRLAAFATPMRDDAAKVLVSGVRGWETTADVLSRAAAPDGEYVFLVGDNALRWAAARRRQYLGRDDDFPTTVMMQWGVLAMRVVKNTRPLPSSIDSIVVQERLPESAYLPVDDLEDF